MRLGQPAVGGRSGKLEVKPEQGSGCCVGIEDRRPGLAAQVQKLALTVLLGLYKSGAAALMFPATMELSSVSGLKFIAMPPPDPDWAVFAVMVLFCTTKLPDARMSFSP